jgi:hypothetical protein
MAARPGGFDQQRGEPQHPAVDGHVVDLHPALEGQFLDVAVGQAEPQVPADGNNDHVGRDPEAGEGGSRTEQDEDGGFSCGESRCSHTVMANATAPDAVLRSPISERSPLVRRSVLC